MIQTFFCCHCKADELLDSGRLKTVVFCGHFWLITLMFVVNIKVAKHLGGSIPFVASPFGDVCGVDIVSIPAEFRTSHVIRFIPLLTFFKLKTFGEFDV